MHDKKIDIKTSPEWRAFLALLCATAADIRKPEIEAGRDVNHLDFPQTYTILTHLCRDTELIGAPSADLLKVLSVPVDLQLFMKQ